MDLQINRIRANIPLNRVVGSGTSNSMQQHHLQQQQQQQQQQLIHQQQTPTSGWGSAAPGNKTLADYVKESSAWPNSNLANSFSAAANANNSSAVPATTTSMPWAAAVKSPPDQHAASTAASNSSSNFDYNNTIGSWSSPETSASNRAGWNADGSSKGANGVFDDGTAIWGNPSVKKTGVDWTEKESSMTNHSSSSSSNNKQHANISSGNHHHNQQTIVEKSCHEKPEPSLSSLNGTEAWGAPAAVASNLQPLSSSSSSSSSNNNSQSNIIHNNNSGNNNSTFGTTKLLYANEWGESSLTSSLQNNNSNERNSSPPNNDCSLWGNLGISKQKSSDWLSSSSGIGSGSNNDSAGSLLDELSKQLESSSLFDSVSSSMTKSASSSSGNNNGQQQHHHHHHQQQALSLGLANGIIGSDCGKGNNGGGGGINDLRQQMSANYPNNLLETPNCQQQGGSLASNNQQQSQQLESAYSAAAAAAAAASAGVPSRDLLKQMVHQIQLAVQAGHLNAHIMNQPMSTPTLQLVYQLLQQIKILHQLQEIQQRAGIKSDINAPSNMDLQINRIRQNISMLQKAITQQQASLTKNNENIGGLNNIKQQQQQQQQQQANNFSYATISKLSTNLKVPSNNNMSNIINNSNLDSFRRSSLIDTFSNSNSDSLRSAQATFDANATLDKTLSSLIRASSSSSTSSGSNNILETSKTNDIINNDGDFSKISSSFNNQPSPNKGVGFLSAQSSTSSTAWSAFNSGDFISQQAWPWGDLNSATLQFNVDNNHLDKPQQQQRGVSTPCNVGAGRPAPPPGLLNNFRPPIGSSSTSTNNGIPGGLGNSSDDNINQLQSRESASNLWSGTWFD